LTVSKASNRRRLWIFALGEAEARSGNFPVMAYAADVLNKIGTSRVAERRGENIVENEPGIALRADRT